MKKYQDKSPEEVIKMVTIEIIERAIKLGKKKNRIVYVSKTSGGKGVEVNMLNPRTEDGRANLETVFQIHQAPLHFSRTRQAGRKRCHQLARSECTGMAAHTFVPSTCLLLNHEGHTE